MKNSHLIAIIGAGEAATPIIHKTRDMGIRSLAFGRIDSINKSNVDYFIEENEFDIKFMATKCLEHGVTGVIASSEITTEATALLANMLGLPGNSIENGFAARNKYIMRCRVSTLQSIKQPNFELYSRGKDYRYPVVVKSIDSCGKQGICLANNRDELDSSVEYAYNNSLEGKVLIEEYLDGGQEYSIESISCNNKHIIVQYTEKESSGPPHFVEIAHHQPANLTMHLKEKINTAVSDVLDVLGISCGMSHLELKIIDDELYFIEVAARAGGDHIGDTLTLLSTDFDYYRAAIECSLGTFVPTPINNVSHTGIYFQNSANKHLSELFRIAPNSKWCIVNSIKGSVFVDASTNVESVDSGYFIYRSDHRIGMLDIISDKEVELLNNNPNSYELIMNFCKTIGTYNSNNFDVWYRKIIEEAYILVVKDKKIYAFMLLYNSNKQTDDCYLCNVYVLDEYRGNGLCIMLLNKVVDICKANHLNTIYLHVDENSRAIGIYKKYGFMLTGARDKTNTLVEMKYLVNES